MWREPCRGSATVVFQLLRRTHPTVSDSNSFAGRRCPVRLCRRVEIWRHTRNRERQHGARANTELLQRGLGVRENRSRRIHTKFRYLYSASSSSGRTDRSSEERGRLLEKREKCVVFGSASVEPGHGPATERADSREHSRDRQRACRRDVGEEKSSGLMFPFGNLVSPTPSCRGSRLRRS